MRFPMSLRRIASVDHKPPIGGYKKHSVQNLKQRSVITSKRYETGCQLYVLLITNEVIYCLSTSTDIGVLE